MSQQSRRRKTGEFRSCKYNNCPDGDVPQREIAGARGEVGAGRNIEAHGSLPRIMACRVAVESPHRHHRLGSQFHIRIDLIVPGGEIVTKHEHSLRARIRQTGEAKVAKHMELKTAHKNLRQAINDVFKAAGRRLQDYARRQRHSVKSHEPLPTARVSKLTPREGYGFITTHDGRESISTRMLY
jgi:hypothetical protein